MTPSLDTNLCTNDWLDATGSMADEHLTMHLYMFESTADDPTSRSFDPGEEERLFTTTEGSSMVRPLGKIRIRTYP